MRKAGIDIEEYRAHSVCGATVSAAAYAGMSTTDIIACADSLSLSDTTFRGFSCGTWSQPVTEWVARPSLSNRNSL